MNTHPLPHDRHVIVCALDGTLADHAGNPQHTTLQLLHDLCAIDEARRELVVVSDKVPALRGDVLTWLNTHVFIYHHLVMRPAGAPGGGADLMRARLGNAGGLREVPARLPMPGQVLLAVDGRADVRAVWTEFGVPCFLAPPSALEVR